jgi:endonuclease YncB( thermonuclease family)
MNYIRKMLSRHKIKKLSEATLDNTEYFSFEGRTITAKCVDVYDGDTCTVALYVGNLGIKLFKVRISGLDTPEIRTRNVEEKKVGLEVKTFVSKIILNKIIILECHSFDKYGRLLANIKIAENNKYLKDILIEAGFGVAYDGGKKPDFNEWYKVPSDDELP